MDPDMLRQHWIESGLDPDDFASLDVQKVLALQEDAGDEADTLCGDHEEDKDNLEVLEYTDSENNKDGSDTDGDERGGGEGRVGGGVKVRGGAGRGGIGGRTGEEGAGRRADGTPWNMRRNRLSRRRGRRRMRTRTCQPT